MDSIYQSFVIILHFFFLFRDAAFATGLPMQNPTDFQCKATNIENIIKNLQTFYQVIAVCNFGQRYHQSVLYM